MEVYCWIMLDMPHISAHGSSSTSNFRSRSDLLLMKTWAMVEPSMKSSNHHNSFDSRTRNNCSITSNSSSSSNPTRSSWSCLMLLEGHHAKKKTGPLQSRGFELWSFVFCARWCLALSGSTWDHTNGQTWNQHWLIDSSRILLLRSFQCWIFCQSFQQ